MNIDGNKGDATMLTVLICSLFNAAMLLGLGGGIVAGFWRSRGRIADALAFAPPVVARAARPVLRPAWPVPA